MKNRKYLLFAMVLVVSGCHSSAVNRLTGKEESKAPTAEHVHEYIRIACCTDNNDTGYPTYPVFLPSSQVELCKTAHAACHNADCQVNGDTHLPVGTGCGRGNGLVGDEYYPPTGY